MGKRLFAGLLYLTICGLLMIGLVEGGVRLLIPQELEEDAPELWLPDADLGWKHLPRARVKVNWRERQVDLCTDEMGDRVSCQTAAPADCARRILLVGDSYVEALSVPYEQHLGHRIEADTGACVAVAGVGGYSPAQYLAQIRQRLKRRDVHYDLILVSFFVGNDLIPHPEAVPPAQVVQWKPFHLLPRGLYKDALYDWFYPMNQWLERRSHTYVAGRSAIRRFQDPGDVGPWLSALDAVRPSRLTEGLLGPTTRSVELMANEARAAGVPLMIMVLPIKNQVLDPDGSKLLKALPKLAGDIDMDLPEKRLLPRWAAIPSLTVVDLLPGLRRTPDRSLWGTADPHMSPKGHAVWFELMREPLRAALKLPQSASR